MLTICHTHPLVDLLLKEEVVLQEGLWVVECCMGGELSCGAPWARLLAGPVQILHACFNAGCSQSLTLFMCAHHLVYGWP